MHLLTIWDNLQPVTLKNDPYKISKFSRVYKRGTPYNFLHLYQTMVGSIILVQEFLVGRSVGATGLRLTPPRNSHHYGDFLGVDCLLLASYQPSNSRVVGKG